MGIGYLSSYLKREGHDVSLLDLNISPATRQGIIERVKAYRPDLVGVPIMCTGMDQVRDVVETVKRGSDVPVVIGGAQASALPEHSLRFTGADYVVVGEGEVTTSELVSALGSTGEVSGILGLGYSADGEFVLNAPRPLIEDLDSLPVPDWHLINPRNYRIAPVLSSAKAFPIAPVVTSRGCPFDCTFCAGKSIWGKTYRYRQSVAVVDEIEMLMQDYGVREIFMGDDNFNLKKSHAMEICEEIIRRRLNLSWACPNGVRVDSLKPDLLALMKRAGCHLLGLGIESGDQVVLDMAKKSLDLSIVPGVCKQIDDAGITAVGFFVLGLPGDTRESIEKTMKFSRDLPLKRAWFNILAPYPGSEIFEMYLKDRNIDSLEWRALDTCGDDVAQMSNVGPEELDKLQKRAAFLFYARPRILFDLLVSQRPATIMSLFRTRFVQKILRRGKDAGTVR
ncbi:MAG: B12-binding domain-containing radical SAM protein [Candidatus Geothermincolia bacterium]